MDIYCLTNEPIKSTYDLSCDSFLKYNYFEHQGNCDACDKKGPYP